MLDGPVLPGSIESANAGKFCPGAWGKWESVPLISALCCSDRYHGSGLARTTDKDFCIARGCLSNFTSGLVPGTLAFSTFGHGLSFAQFLLLFPPFLEVSSQ